MDILSHVIGANRDVRPDNTSCKAGEAVGKVFPFASFAHRSDAFPVRERVYYITPCSFVPKRGLRSEAWEIDG
jgi:hypothetical protein